MNNNWSILLSVTLISGTVFTGCGDKKEKPAAKTKAPTESAAPVESTRGPMPAATPREYLVDGKIDLKAISETYKEYIAWTKNYPSDVNELVTSGFITALPKPPAGQKYNVDPTMMQQPVTLVPDGKAAAKTK